jgi:hypothetical protein
MNNSNINILDTSLKGTLANLEDHQCIYCLNKTGTFESRSHYLTEGLGCLESILPHGYECDTCNHRILGRLDNWVQSSALVAPGRVMFVPETKKGKPPRAEFPSLTIRHTQDLLSASVPAKRPKPYLDDLKPTGNRTYSGSFNVTRLARWLYRAALAELACLKGREAACSARYDRARDFIMGRRNGFDNNLLMIRDWTYVPKVDVQPLDFEMTGTLFVLNLYGIQFLLSLEESEEVYSAPQCQYSFGAKLR